MTGADGAAGVTVRPLTAGEAELVPDLWRSAWGGAARLYPLEERVWRERLGAHHDPDLLLGAFAGAELVGAAYGRTATADWLPAQVGWVSLLAVAGPWQGRGIGGALLAALLERLRRSGATRFRLGSDANHLLPGPPQESLPALWRLARRAGARFLAAEHDLHVDLRLEPPPAPLPDGWRVRDDDPDGAMAFLARTFPGRWAAEVDAYLAAGTKVLTLEKDGEGRADGFCAVFTGDEALLGPSLYWRAALASEVGGPSGAAAGGGQAPGVSGPRVMGMGPLGVSESARGAGLGLAMVRAGAVWLRESGATDLIINWTSLTPFYGRLGARVWRTYQRAEGPL